MPARTMTLKSFLISLLINVPFFFLLAFQQGVCFVCFSSYARNLSLCLGSTLLCSVMDAVKTLTFGSAFNEKVGGEDFSCGRPPCCLGPVCPRWWQCWHSCRPWVCVLVATVLFICSENKGQCGAGNVFSCPVSVLQWLYRCHWRYPWSWTGVLYWLGIVRKHGIIIEK